ncbi:hypothetical protein PC118_g14997 [Phytophthora cactorum]|uniref:Uncharacterized protein n=1 Tax=Phytophthora cactorum TaxID=29920 RepID=A0A8T1FKL4_9STRA|nr:hypothetical protein PC118_g14997 [Phytophthora cactorum]
MSSGYHEPPQTQCNLVKLVVSAHLRVRIYVPQTTNHRERPVEPKSKLFEAAHRDGASPKSLVKSLAKTGKLLWCYRWARARAHNNHC